MHAFDFPQTIESILIIDNGDGACSCTVNATVTTVLSATLLNTLTDWIVVNVADLRHSETLDFVVASLATIGMNQGHAQSC